MDIDQVCVVGTGLPQPIALLTLSEAGKAKPQPQVESEIKESIASVNSTLEKYEHIQAAVILRDEWSIESGLMTPSMKIKRNAVEKKYESRYKDWAGRDGVVVWE